MGRTAGRVCAFCAGSLLCAQLSFARAAIPEGHRRGKAPHPSAACGGTSPCRGGFAGDCRLERLPCKGLRSRAPPAAEKAVSHAANSRHSFHYRLFGDRKHKTALRSSLRSLPLRGNAAVAERKCASAHAARCGHRKPVTRPQPTEGCRTWPCQYPSGPPQTFPAGVNARPTMQGKRAAGSGTAGMAGG